MRAIIMISLLATAITSQAQKEMIKTIEVTGEHELQISPDEVTFSITIEEYWEEEFQEDKEYKDYRTKVGITTIEDSLIAELNAAGITMDMITLKQSGNQWRQRGKDFLISKSMDLKLRSAEIANQLSNDITTRGIRNMAISDMTVNDIETYQLDAKVEALKSAKQKAEKLAAAVGKTIKDVVSIIEVDPYVGVSPRPYAEKAMLRSADAGGGAQYENFKKVNVKAVVRVVWEMD